MIPLASSTWDSNELRSLAMVIESGRFTMGAKVRDFERRFAERVGARYAVMVNSGSSANLLMIWALIYTGRLARDATVIVPAVSWGTTYAPLIQAGLKLRIVDVDDSLTIDPRLAHGGDLIFGVNLLGNPCDFGALPDIPLIVDNCESLGCRYQGREGGTFGLMGSYSFFFSHHICTIEGGAVVTDDPQLYEMLLMLRAHGWERDLPGFRADFERMFVFQVPGFNVRPTEFSGALGTEQLYKLDEIIGARRRNGGHYQRLFERRQRENGESSWYGFALFHKDRSRIVKNLMAETRPIVAGNILRHPMMRWAAFEAEATPVADMVHEEGFFVGNPAVDLRLELEALAEEVR